MTTKKRSNLFRSESLPEQKLQFRKSLLKGFGVDKHGSFFILNQELLKTIFDSETISTLESRNSNDSFGDPPPQKPSISPSISPSSTPSPTPSPPSYSSSSPSVAQSLQSKIQQVVALDNQEEGSEENVPKLFVEENQQSVTVSSSNERSIYRTPSVIYKPGGNPSNFNSNPSTSLINNETNTTASGTNDNNSKFGMNNNINLSSENSPRSSFEETSKISKNKKKTSIHLFAFDKSKIRLPSIFRKKNRFSETSSEEEEGKKHRIFFPRKRNSANSQSDLRNSDDSNRSGNSSGQEVIIKKAPIPLPNINGEIRRPIQRTNSDSQPLQDAKDFVAKQSSPPLVRNSSFGRSRRSSANTTNNPSALPSQTLLTNNNNNPPLPLSMTTKKQEANETPISKTNTFTVSPIPIPSEGSIGTTINPSSIERRKLSKSSSFNAFDSPKNIEKTDPNQNQYRKGHRRSSYDPNSLQPITTNFETHLEENESPIDSEDETCTNQTLNKVNEFTHYLEEYYWELLTYINNRKKREQKFQESLNSNSHYPKDILEKEHYKEENIILRSRRLCGGLKDFKLIKRIGKGAFGEVILARKIKTNELVALKKISKSNQDKKQITHVKTEQGVLADASSLWLVQLLYSFQDSNYIYFAMEYIPGGDFRHFLGEIQKVGDLAENEVCFYAAEMFLAVNALHHLGYIHRDLKPDNFLIDKNGHLKLADFGLSKKGIADYQEPFVGQIPKIGYSTTVLGTRTVVEKKREKYLQQRKQLFSLVGSPDYMSVELLRESAIDFCSDWWSLGCIVFEMIVGFPPFSAETPREVFQNVLNYKEVLENPEYENGEKCIKPDAWNFINKLICEPQDRIGRESFDQIKKHKFFKDLDWDNIKSTKAPYPPNLNGEEDTTYFPNAEPINEEIKESPDSKTFLQKIEELDESLPDFSNISFSSELYKKQKTTVDLVADHLKRKKTLQNRSPSGLEKIGRLFSRTGSLVKDNKRLFDTVSLNQLSLRDWKVLCTGAHRIVLSRGTMIIQEGQKNNFLYRIRSGVVRIEKKTSKGTLAFQKLQKNEVFGEMSFIEDHQDSEEIGNVSASVIVDSHQVELYKIDKFFVFSIFMADKDLFGRFYKIIACTLAERLVYLPFRKEVEKVKQSIDRNEEQIILDVNRLSKKDPDKDKSRQDTKFCKRFKLPPEVLIQCIDNVTLHLKKRNFNGKLYIGEKHLCFYSKIFEYRHKEIISFKDILDIIDEHDKVKIIAKDKHYLFSIPSGKEEILIILDKLFVSAEENFHVSSTQSFSIDQNPHSSLVDVHLESSSTGSKIRDRRATSVGHRLQRRSGSNEDELGIDEDLSSIHQDLSLSQSDWSLILQGSEFSTYTKDEVILSEVDESHSIYQIGRGSCRIEKLENGKPVVLGIMQQSEMFGEISFLTGAGATVTILANENNVDIFKIDRDYIFKIFEKNPSIAGKFYKFLSWVLARRVRQRETEILDSLSEEDLNKN